MYVLGLIMLYTPFNSHTINNYSDDFYKETYCSCISYIIKTLVHSILYLDNQLNKVKCNSRSMAFELLKLKCPVYRVIRIHVVDISTKNVFYCPFINLFFYILIVSKLYLSQRYTFVNESIESNTKYIEFECKNSENNLKCELHFDRLVDSLFTFFIYVMLYVLLCFINTIIKKKLFYLYRKEKMVFRRNYVFYFLKVF